MQHTAPDPEVRKVSLMEPLQWLGLAWRDMERAPWPGLLHGLVAALVAVAAFVFAHQRFWLLAGAFSGFLLVAPLVATGLYAISRALEQGQKPGLTTVVSVWRSGDSRLVRFGLLLALAGTGWVVTSAAVITAFSPTPITTPLDFARHVMLARDHWLFEAWLMLGALMAAPVFASSVVAIPLLLDRPVTVRQAVLTSWRCVLANPVPLALWASLIMGFTLLGLGSLALGLIAVVPMLGHASWHAYRDLIAPEDTADVADAAGAPGPGCSALPRLKLPASG